MASNLIARLKALEATQVDDDKVGGVLQLLRGETVEEALARAAKEGRTGNFLVVPPVLTLDEWQEAAREHHQHQQELKTVYQAAMVPDAAVSPAEHDPPTRAQPLPPS